MSPRDRSENRLDALARAFTEDMPRRTALKRVAAFFAGAAFFSPVDAFGAKKKKCPRGRRLCGGRCCPTGFSCRTVKGKHKCVCAKPKKVCAGTCIDPRVNERHCGSCGHVCKPGEKCLKGKCSQPQQPPPKGCTTDAQCAPAAAGTCRRAVCDTSTGTCTAAIDDTNVPDDGNPCTTGVCANGVASEAPVAEGRSCGANGMVCNATGSCVGCDAAADCPGTDTECATRTCTASTCGFSYSASGTAVAAQTPGDCQQNVCDGAGNVHAVTDDSDTPAASGQCTMGVCTAGVPSQASLPAGTACSEGGTVCNGTGSCVGCNAVSDCPPAANPACATRTCTASTCGFSYQPSGTFVSSGTSGDCQQNVCDGAGATISVADDSNTPAASDQCHRGICTTGQPSQTPAPQGTSCGTGMICDGQGTCATNNFCVGVTCAPSDQCHSMGVCNPANGVCSNPPLPNGTACDDGNACTQNDTCQAGVCSGGAPMSCTAQDECHAAGTCNQMTGVCSNPPFPDGTHCTGGACSGGVCSVILNPG